MHTCSLLLWLNSAVCDFFFTHDGIVTFQTESLPMETTVAQQKAKKECEKSSSTSALEECGKSSTIPTLGVAQKTTEKLIPIQPFFAPLLDLIGCRPMPAWKKWNVFWEMVTGQAF